MHQYCGAIVVLQHHGVVVDVFVLTANFSVFKEKSNQTKLNKIEIFSDSVHQYCGAVVVLQHHGVVVDVFVLTAVVVVALLVVCATFVSRKKNLVK